MFKPMAFKHFVVKMHFSISTPFLKKFNIKIFFNFEKEECCILMMEWLEQGIWRCR
jgi:hypothetical protein